jgi:hypothetical protein
MVPPPEAAREATAALGKIATELTDLDANANARLEAIVAAGEAGKAELERVEKDVEAGGLELGPAGDAAGPAGVAGLRRAATRAGRTVINEAMATADDNARQTRELTDRYAGVAVEAAAPAAPAAADAAAGGGGSSTTTPSATDPGGPRGRRRLPPAARHRRGQAEPASTAATANPFGTMPGHGDADGGHGRRHSDGAALGGGLGGLPSFGGDPMSALSGLGGGEPPMG